MNTVIGKTSYVLQSVATGCTFEDSGWILDPQGEEKPSLVRAIYKESLLNVKADSWGIYKFADWLPIGRTLAGSSAPITYKSEGLAKELGLSNLYVTFTGWWPERGAYNRTCSFKETEAYSVCGRLAESSKTLVVASAGNTARAFAKVCSDNRIPLILCVPEDNLDALWFDAPLNDCVKLICPKKGADYFDAINLSNLVSQLEGYITEGGAKNIARRDGMGTTMLSAATFIGRIPDYYFQAVGSGTGAIAAWEANLRLITDGRFGNGKSKLMVSQNAPFTPMFDAWKADSRALLPMEDDEARQKVEIITAKVLSNRKPPYSITGGLFDALKDTNGDILVATNEEAAAAAALFEELEGIDIHPAASVAVASLISEVKRGEVDKNATIMLNITGGGENRYKSEHQLFYLKPSAIFDFNPTLEEVKQALKLL
ncbi:cysteate synthase [Acetobacteroides hydrogenigenes]|uniref:Cysteate synthase n=1 Tax=Acetobacteroides hydrogenigenes TaxID=979970 RepID=A0A4R2EIZ2_9BACT|nr:cysteate synthase [Acetobacteroides hydrogenigenes]TCN68978.1 cysteate synthase [Acetobacteroides hydrogenigenes]